VNLLEAVAGPTWKTNPGKCWVSYKCFEVQNAAEYIREQLAQFKNIRVMYNTVVKDATKAENGTITEVTAIQRYPINSTGYESLYS